MDLDAVDGERRHAVGRFHDGVEIFAGKAHDDVGADADVFPRRSLHGIDEGAEVMSPVDEVQRRVMA